MFEVIFFCRGGQTADPEAVSTVIGTRAMGTGFNRLMTIQVPMKQHAVRPMRSPSIGFCISTTTTGTTDTTGGGGLGFPAVIGFPKAVPMCGAFGAPQAQAMAAPAAAPGGAFPTAACGDLFAGLGTTKAAGF